MKKLEEKIMTIDNVTFKYRFGLRSMMLFTEVSGKDVTEIDSADDVISFTYCGYQAYCFYHNQELKYTYDQYLNFLDDYPESIEKVTSLVIENNQKKRKVK